MVPGIFANGKVLITGATGFVGANLTHHLTSLGICPHITIRQESNTWRINNILKQIKLHYVDLTDKQGIEKVISEVRPKLIYHCATYGGYFFQKDLNKIIQANIIGTVNLLEACLKIEFPCFINTGSSSEYGIKQQPMKESDLLEPVNNYGAAKASTTLFCHALAKREKLPIVTLRLFSPYGYYEDSRRLIVSAILSCLEGRDIQLSSPDSVRDFIFIEDVLSACIKAAENIDKVAAEIINIGSGKQYSVGEVVNKIIGLTAAKVEPKWDSVTNPRNEPLKWLADVKKANKLLGWKPANDLEEGLKNTIRWFKNNIELYNGKN
jgi:nucleoside-diphosphate-sugar epimerase